MKSRKTGSYIAVMLAAIGTVALLAVRAVAVEAAYPVERAGKAVSVSVWSRLSGLFHASAAAAENVKLRREVAALAVLKGDVERLEKENARLRRALGYSAHEPEAWVAAEVLSSGGGAAGVRDVVRVNRGSLAGVRTGAVVVVPEGLVGRVTAVTPHTAEVLLVTDPSLKVACEVETGSSVRLRGILSGGSPDLLVLRHLRNAAAAPSGSRVLTSGLGGVFPRGLEVGTLLCVTNGVRSVEGGVAPRVEFSTLEDVFIRRAK